MKDGKVQAGQVLIKLDTETSKEQKTSYENQLKAIDETLALKQQELKLEFLELELKKTELARTIEMSQEEVTMLKNKLQLDSEILTRYETLALEGAESELRF